MDEITIRQKQALALETLWYAKIPSSGFKRNATLLHPDRQVSSPSVSDFWMSVISKAFAPDSIFARHS
jgi:hypothetical protein